MQQNLILDAQGTTTEGISLVRALDLSRVSKINVQLESGTKALGYSGGPADMTLTLNDGTTVTIKNGFGIGYRGTGPWGVYEILVKDFHFSDEEASKIFVPYSNEIYWSVE